MKKLLSLLLVSFLLTLTISLPAYGVGFKAGENLNISEILTDDHYIAGGRVVIDKDVTGDLYIAGGEVIVNGNVADDLVIAGGRVTVMGNVGDDLRAFGGQVTIFGNVGDDLITGGGMVDISPNSVIGGTIVGGAGYLTMGGEVMEDIQGGFGMLILNGKVGGNVTVTVEEKVEISENAKIMGDLNYSALLEMDFPENTVEGEIKFNKFTANEGADEMVKQLNDAYLGWKMWSFLSALLILGLLAGFMSKMLLKAGSLAKADLLKTFGIGILTVIVAFVGSIILMATVVGIPLALISFIILMISCYLAKIFVSAVFASFIINTKKKKYFKLKLFGLMTVGLFAYYMIGFIPYVGWFLNIVLFLIGIGAIVLCKQEQIKILRSKGVL
jgi:hypothetical protein